MCNNEILEQNKGAKNVKKSMTVLIVVWIWAFRSLFLRKIDVRQKRARGRVKYKEWFVLTLLELIAKIKWIIAPKVRVSSSK